MDMGARTGPRYTRTPAATRRSHPLEFPQVSREEDLPAEQPQAQASPRVPSSDANPGRPRDPGEPSRQGPDEAVGLTPAERTSVRSGRALRPREIRAVLDVGRRASGPR